MPPDPFLSALVDAALPWDEVPRAPRDRVLADTTRFVAGQLGALPREWRLLFTAGLLTFRAAVRARHGRSFVDLSTHERRAIFERWAWGRVALARQLMRPVRTTALLAFFEHPDVAGAP